MPPRETGSEHTHGMVSSLILPCEPDITFTVFNIVIARINSIIPKPVGGNRNLEVSCTVSGAGVVTTTATGTVLISGKIVVPP